MAALEQRVIDDLRSLDPDGQAGVLDDVLGTYLRDARQRLRELHAAADSDDPDRLHAVAHSLKGASRSVGANGVAAICERLERADISHCRTELDSAGAELERVFAEIDVLLPGQSGL